MVLYARKTLIILLALPVLLSAQWQGWNAHQKYKGWEKSETAEVDTTTYTLDRYPGAVAAYSLRLLDKDYAGSSCITIRRSSDDATLDIGFVGGEWDSVSALAFVGAGDGFVATWHDQSGNGYNLAQATTSAQPQIISLGNTVNKNGKISIDFDGAAHWLGNNILSTTSNNLYHIIVFSIDNTSTEQTLIETRKDESTNSNAHAAIGFAFGGSNRIGSRSANTSLTFVGAGNAYSSTAQSLLVQNAEMTTPTNAIYINSTLGTQTYQCRSNDGYYAARSITIGARSDALPSYFFNGTIQEIIIYDSDQSANRTAIEGNINNYYGIY